MGEARGGRQAGTHADRQAGKVKRIKGRRMQEEKGREGKEAGRKVNVGREWKEREAEVYKGREEEERRRTKQGRRRKVR